MLSQALSVESIILQYYMAPMFLRITIYNKLIIPVLILQSLGEMVQSIFRCWSDELSWRNNDNNLSVR